MFLHQLHVLVVHEGAMLDRIHPPDHRAADRLGAVRVRGDGESVIVRGSDNRLDLLDRHLCVIDAGTFVEHAAGRHDLDQVRAVLVVLAYRFPCVIGTIDDAHDGCRVAHQVGAVAICRIGMAAGGTNRHAGAVDARSRHNSGVDRIAQRDGFVGAIGDVAHGGEAGHQRAPRIHRAADCVVGDVQAEIVAVLGRARFLGQVHVAVDQAGQAGASGGNVDHGRAGSIRASRHDFADALAIDHDRRRAEHTAGDAVE